MQAKTVTPFDGSPQSSKAKVGQPMVEPMVNQNRSIPMAMEAFGEVADSLSISYMLLCLSYGIHVMVTIEK